MPPIAMVELPPPSRFGPYGCGRGLATSSLSSSLAPNSLLTIFFLSLIGGRPSSPLARWGARSSRGWGWREAPPGDGADSWVVGAATAGDEDRGLSCAQWGGKRRCVYSSLYISKQKWVLTTSNANIQTDPYTVLVHSQAVNHYDHVI